MERSTPTLQHVLEDFLFKEDLQGLCEAHGIPSHGDKDTLVHRLLGQGTFQPRDALRLLDRTQLIDLCHELGIDDSGKRDPLISRVARALGTPPGATDVGPPVP